MNTHHLIVRLAVTLSLAISLLWMAEQSFAAEVQEPIRKFDPRTQEFVAVDANDVEAGKIYNHYSERYKRYVWAYALKDGKFSYALGPGTTEVPTNFALTISAQETERLFEERTFGERRSPWEDNSYKVRLGEDGEWTVIGSATTICRSHFDLDSGRRWEWHGGRRVAVGSINSSSWRYDDGRYVPTHPWLWSPQMDDGRFVYVP